MTSSPRQREPQASADQMTSAGSVAVRASVSAVIGLLAGCYTLWVRLSGRFTFSDFDQLWIGARAVLHGQNPYDIVPHQFAWPLFYPMPAVVITLPFAALPIEWAPALWIAISVGLLAYALSGKNWWLLLLLATNPAVNAMELGQWSPLLTAAALIPGLEWTLLAKPTTGTAVIAGFREHMPSRRVVVASLAIVVVSFLLCPTWVSRWINALRTAHHFIPLVLRPWGWVMLAALIRWRRPEARLLVLLSVVPMTMAAYEAVPLFLVPRTRLEIVLMAGLTVAAQIGASRTPAGLTFVDWLARNATYYFVFLYLPTLIMVLRRPNAAPSNFSSDGRVG